jgi:hypothetical protein
MTKVTFGSALIVLMSCAPSEEEIKKEFDAYVAERNACMVTDDCVIASTGCPLGCGTAVNRVYQAAVEAKARELVDEYESEGQKCYYDCNVPVPVCMDGRCVTQ